MPGSCGTSWFTVAVVQDLREESIEHGFARRQKSPALSHEHLQTELLTVLVRTPAHLSAGGLR